MAGRNGNSPVTPLTRSRGRIVALLSGDARGTLPSELHARRELVLREFSGVHDSRTPIESVDVVFHVFVDEALESMLTDILILPQPPNVIAFALRKAARGRLSELAKSSRVIMVSSTKGGTGKTSLAVNLAVGLAEKRVRTLLLDLDVQFGDVGIVLGLERPQRTLHDLA